jgi:protocatechuate 3,4-dioxygenase, beta subunit
MMHAYAPLDPAAHPPTLAPDYKSSLKRAPLEPLVRIPQTPTEATGPDDWRRILGHAVADLTKGHAGAPIGERIVVTGHVLEEGGRPVRETLVEIWQANAAGRYLHPVDQHDAPLDPNFTGVGRLITDDEGRYRFYTIEPGAYPWRNHRNAWRPKHIHFSVMGPAFATRLVTQMYFPGDPLIGVDPIAQSVPKDARERLIARLDLDVTEEGFALGYIFDIVLRGRHATPLAG